MIYLLSVHGKDRRGLVEALANHIEERGGNWLESRLCRLGGQFAGIVRIEFGQPPMDLPSQVETLICQWDRVEEEEAAQAEAIRATLQIVAADRPGLVKQITRLLRGAGANVEEIETRVFSAPFSGEQMFDARFQVTLESESESGRLAGQLESLAEELMCDIEFAPVDSVGART